MSIVNVKELMDEMIQKNKKIKLGIIKGYWFKIVGDLAVKTEPVKLENDVLLVLVENSIYSHHMSMNKNKYLKLISKYLKQDEIKDIRYKISSIDKHTYENLVLNEENLFETEVEKEDEEKSKFLEMEIDEKIEFLKIKSKKREEILKLYGYKKCKNCEVMFLGSEDFCAKCFANISLNKKMEEN